MRFRNVSFWNSLRGPLRTSGRRRSAATTMLALVGALALVGLAAQPAAAAPKPPAFAGGFPVTKRSEIFKVQDLKVGDRGIGYTVFRGGEVKPFEVEVLGIMQGMLGPHRDVILAKLIGPEIEFTGVISGMSGSPVYVDGRLLGAVSYRFGTFSKEAIAGITPIETMFDVSRDPQLFPGPTASTAAVVKLSMLHAGPGKPVAVLPRVRRVYEDEELRPIDTPITLGGFAPVEAEALRARLAEAGVLAVIGAGSSGGSAPRSSVARRSGGPRPTTRLAANVSSTAGGVVAPPIAPASPIAAVLMRGDLDAAGTGTVTYMEGDEVLAFGHPFFGYGHVAFPMATAAILNTLASPLGSYKMSAQALEVGIISQDRLSAIGGKLGQVAAMIPATIRVEADRRDRAPIVTEVEIVDHELWFPNMIGSAIGSAAVGRIAEETGGTVDLVARITLRERAPQVAYAASPVPRSARADRTLVIADTYTAAPPYRPSSFAAQDVAGVAAMLMRNGLASAELIDVQVSLVVRPTVELMWLEAVVAQTQVVQPGARLELRARVRPYRAEPFWMPLAITIPADARGEVEVVVGGSGELDARDEAAYGDRAPDDLDDLLGILSERRTSKKLYARVYLKRPGVRAGTEILSSLPPSLRLGLEDVVGVRERAIAETVGPSTSVASSGVIVGSQTLKIQVLE